MALIIKKKSCVIFCRYLVGHHNLSSKKYFLDLGEISNLPNSNTMCYGTLRKKYIDGFFDNLIFLAPCFLNIYIVQANFHAHILGFINYYFIF
jgi:hypothetical protein